MSHEYLPPTQSPSPFTIISLVISTDHHQRPISKQFGGSRAEAEAATASHLIHNRCHILVTGWLSPSPSTYSSSVSVALRLSSQASK